MKRVSIYLTALVAVFSFNACQQNDPIPSNNSLSADTLVSEQPSGELRIAFFYGDSINANYDFLLDAEEELEGEQKRMDERINRKLQRAEKRYQELNQQAPTMTQAQMQEAQLEMQGMDVELRQFQERLATELRTREIELQKEYLKRVNDFLDVFNADGQYDFILNYQQGGNIIWAKKSFDITEEVVEGLNKIYKEELSSKDSEKESSDVSNSSPKEGK